MKRSSRGTAAARHEQISDWLRAQIEGGDRAAHEQLPSEKALGEQFAVSRITVRRALQTLENEGLIYRRQGLGSFVAEPPIRQGLVRLTDFDQDMTRAGLRASSRVLRYDTEPLPQDIAARLGLTAGTAAMRLERIRLGDGLPVAFDRTWLPLFYGQLLEGHDLGQTTIYRILESEYGIPILGGRYRIEAANAPPDVAAVLEVPDGRALLVVNRLSYTVAERPVYFQKRYYRSDRVAYELELSRNGTEPASADHGMPLRDFEPVFTVQRQG